VGTESVFEYVGTESVFEYVGTESVFEYVGAENVFEYVGAEKQTAKNARREGFNTTTTPHTPTLSAYISSSLWSI